VAVKKELVSVLNIAAGDLFCVCLLSWEADRPRTKLNTVSPI
jgi:hypothetical protein